MVAPRPGLLDARADDVVKEADVKQEHTAEHTTDTEFTGRPGLRVCPY